MVDSGNIIEHQRSSSTPQRETDKTKFHPKTHKRHQHKKVTKAQDTT